MRDRLGRALIIVVGAITAVSLATLPIAGQARAYRAPRTADGKPNLNGIWQAINEANWDIEAHAAAPGMVRELGATQRRLPAAWASSKAAHPLQAGGAGEEERELREPA